MKRTVAQIARIVSLVASVAMPAGAFEPAAGGAPIVESCESATLVAVVAVQETAGLDEQGRAARVEVERVLAGDPATTGPLRIAWEELARGRPDRFRAGDRLLVVLSPLPNGSLWRNRFPPSATEPPALAVAARGEAFLHQPDDRSIERLARWAQLAPSERDASPGAEALAHLAADAHPVLAAAAVERLGRIADLAQLLGVNTTPVLATAIGDASRADSVRAVLLRLAGVQRLRALRDAILPLAAAGNPLEAEAIDALARIDDGITAEHAESLLQRTDPKVRVAALRRLGGPGAGPRLAALVRSDPAAVVRAAAVSTLLERAAPGAEADAEPALFDRDPTVRAAAAEGFGRLGERAVPRLRRLALDRSADDAKGPIAALSLAGASGAAVLQELATTHGDDATRRLAAFALGHVPSHDRGLETQPPADDRAGRGAATPAAR